MFRGAIFDMDGVLVDSMPIHLKAFGATAARYGVDFQADKVMALSGMGNREFFRALFPADVLEQVGWQRLAQEKEALYREIFAAELAPMAGLMDFLNELRTAGIRIAVGTSAPTANMDFVFDGLGIRPFFDAIVNGDMVARTKPDPEIYTLAVSKLGLSADECLVFEDAVMGVEAARRAGVRCVALTSSVPEAILQQTPGISLIINDFRDVNVPRLQELFPR